MAVTVYIGSDNDNESGNDSDININSGSINDNVSDSGSISDIDISNDIDSKHLLLTSAVCVFTLSYIYNASLGLLLLQLIQ